MSETQALDPAQEETTEATERDTFTRDLIRESVKAARKGARQTTAVNLGHAERLVMAIEHEIVKAANTLDDVKTFRLQTIGLFSAPLSRAEGKTITAKQLAEYVAIHHMLGCLPEDSQATAKRVPWEHLRTLLPWAVQLHGETTLVQGETYAEEWKIKEGREEKIVDLLATLSRHPMSRKGLTDEMAKHDRAVNGTEEKTSEANDFDAVTKLLKSITKTAEKLDMSKVDLAFWVLKSGTLRLTDITAAADIIQEQESRKPTKSAGPATITLNATSKPNNDPLANAQTRKIA